MSMTALYRREFLGTTLSAAAAVAGAGLERSPEAVLRRRCGAVLGHPHAFRRETAVRVAAAAARAGAVRGELPLPEARRNRQNDGAGAVDLRRGAETLTRGALPR